MRGDRRLEEVADAYRAHAEEVYRLAFAILHDADEALDATQDAFVRAFEQWDRYDPSCPLRPWLHTIASRICLDLLRRRKVRQLAITQLGGRAATYPAPEHDDPQITVPRREAVVQAIAGLSSSARAALVLRYRFDYDYAEIATMLGTSVTNVGAILTRARQHIRESTDSPVPQPFSGEAEA